ncbi:leucyl aminopeptidase [Clostridium sp. MSJ-4]|uniref:Probable cytosol aminopeptidase n=1 Tax=Clostridium simiarum TaxID=2841506 RepID=A0ABS6F3I8_9CLOT|nr:MULTISPECIES: leucyl aminopeptidase [Clostridium]MBU5592117.1 leucyl aminopeptidase [Clostridium simiarum]
MDFFIRDLNHTEADGLIYPLFQDDSEENICGCVKSQVDKLKKAGKFKGEAGELFYTVKEVEDGFQYTLLLGLGKKEALSSETIRLAYAKALKKVKELKLNNVLVKMFESNEVCIKRRVKAIYEGMILANYKFDKYLSEKKESSIKEVFIKGIKEEDKVKAEEALGEAKVLASAVIEARELVNEPANFLDPKELAKRAKNIGKEYGFQVEVHEKDKIEELGMHSFMEVAKGSSRDPRLIVMRYFGDEANKEDILGLVGKGLTYDSGGYSIKPTDGMVTMKSDMGGAAAVIGAMASIAKMKLKINVVAVVAACENMISGKAYKPGDIISSMAGKTIEVLNTDAEGRLTLIDAVHYAIEKEKASKVVDVATLTGAVLVALGNTTTGVVTNNNDFYKELEKASELSGEKVWQLPAFDEYKKLIKSDIADLKNIGGRNAGTITAGLFIGEFVQNKPWLHLDIAGTAWSESEKEYLSKGGTGAGVRILYYLAKEKSCKESCNK